MKKDEYKQTLDFIIEFVLANIDVLEEIREESVAEGTYDFTPAISDFEEMRPAAIEYAFDYACANADALNEMREEGVGNGCDGSVPTSEQIASAKAHYSKIGYRIDLE